MEKIIEEKLKDWLSDYVDEETKKEILKIKEEQGEEGLKELFLEDLEFGTGGMRGIIGPGSSRINIYTIGKATFGIVNYLLDNKSNENEILSVVVSYDTRNFSYDFAKEVASIFAYFGIKVYIFSNPTPIGILSFAIRIFNANLGIMITASHNPPEYNGYKVYNSMGGQIVPPQDGEIIKYVKNVKFLKYIKKIDFEKGLQSKIIEFIDEDFYNEYFEKILNIIINKNYFSKVEDLKIAYTSLHGTGIFPFKKLSEKLNLNVFYPEKQIIPDGNFPTVEVPNPEVKESLKMVIDTAKKNNADVFIANDPDADRLGLGFRIKEGYYLPDGNEIGIAYLFYILSEYNNLKMLNKIKNPYVCNTIVTSDLQEKIAKSFNVKIFRTLTGFKYIGEIMNKNNDGTFLFGAEESYGYLIGDHARDKDAIVSTLLALEIAIYLKIKGIYFDEFLNSIYEKFGYYKNKLVSYTFKGLKGKDKILKIMNYFRNNVVKELCNMKIVNVVDYLNDNTKLPKSNVLQYFFDSFKITLRPSGTEPKIKFYYQINGKYENKLEINKKLDLIISCVNNIIDNITKE